MDGTRYTPVLLAYILSHACMTRQLCYTLYLPVVMQLFDTGQAPDYTSNTNNCIQHAVTPSF